MGLDHLASQHLYLRTSLGGTLDVHYGIYVGLPRKCGTFHTVAASTHPYLTQLRVTMVCRKRYHVFQRFRFPFNMSSESDKYLRSCRLLPGGGGGRCEGQREPWRFCAGQCGGTVVLDGRPGHGTGLRAAPRHAARGAPHRHERTVRAYSVDPEPSHGPVQWIENRHLWST